VKPLLTRLAIHKALGLYIGEQEIAISRVAATPWGPVEVARDCEPYTPDDLEVVLHRLVRRVGGRRKRVLAAVGLPASRLFYAVRPLHAANHDVPPEGLLQKALQSPTVCIDELVVELLRTQVNKKPMAALAACRRKYLTGLLPVLEGCGLRVARAEPAPCALVRVALQQHRAPRRGKLVLRVFLSDTHGLAVVVAGEVALAWRTFVLPAGREDAAILCVGRTLKMLSRHYGIDVPVDLALMHGRSDLRERLEDPVFVAQLGIPVECHAGPSLDGPTVAFGLALGCLKTEQQAFDLARTLKQRPSLWELVPWGETALQISLVVCMGLLLTGRYLNVQEARAAVQAENSRHECLASAGVGALEKERKDLHQRVEAVRKFLESRILWTPYTHDLPARLPAQAYLTSVHGLCELTDQGKKKEATIKPKKSFVLRGAAPISPDGSIPKDIDALLTAVRNHPLLKRDFPIVQLSDIKRIQSLGGAQPMVNFTVICLPPAKPAAGGGGESHDTKDAP
jgi:hypothetical protein